MSASSWKDTAEKKTSSENRIDCDFKWVPGYYYAEYEERIKPLEKEYEAAKEAGLMEILEFLHNSHLVFSHFIIAIFPSCG